MKYVMSGICLVEWNFCFQINSYKCIMETAEIVNTGVKRDTADS